MTTTHYFVIYKYGQITEPTLTVLPCPYNPENPILDGRIICVNYIILNQSTWFVKRHIIEIAKNLNEYRLQLHTSHNMHQYLLATLIVCTMSIFSVIIMMIASPVLITYAQSQIDVPKMIQNGIFLFNQRKYGDAIKAFDKVLGVEPNNTYVLNQKGNALYTLGKNEEAVKVFDESLAVDPNNTRALNSKGLISGILGKNDEALAYFGKALAIDPNNTEALNGKALALNFLGKPNEAMIYLNKGLTVEPNNTDILTSKGLILNSLGRNTDALAYFDRVLEIDPNNFYVFSLKMKLQNVNITK